MWYVVFLCVGCFFWFGVRYEGFLWIAVCLLFFYDVWYVGISWCVWSVGYLMKCCRSVLLLSVGCLLVYFVMSVWWLFCDVLYILMRFMFVLSWCGVLLFMVNFLWCVVGWFLWCMVRSFFTHQKNNIPKARNKPI